MCLLSLFSFRHLDEVEVYHEDHELILTHFSESLDMVKESHDGHVPIYGLLNCLN
jgi:virulence-associated protein VagC